MCLALSIVDSTGTRFNSLRGYLSKISVADLSFIAWVVDCGDGVHREGHSSDMLQALISTEFDIFRLRAFSGGSIGGGCQPPRLARSNLFARELRSSGLRGCFLTSEQVQYVNQ